MEGDVLQNNIKNLLDQKSVSQQACQAIWTAKL